MAQAVQGLVRAVLVLRGPVPAVLVQGPDLQVLAQDLVCLGPVSLVLLVLSA